MSGDADLRRVVGYNIQRAHTAIMGEVNRTLAPFGLRRATYSALSVIAGTPGLKQADLSAILAIERPNLVQVIDELASASLITRKRLSEDRRAWALRATLPGKRLLAQADAALMAYDTQLTRDLSDQEREALIRALQRVEANGPPRMEEELDDDRLSAP